MLNNFSIKFSTMNTKIMTVFVLMVMVLSVNAISMTKDKPQDITTVTSQGIYDGYDMDDGYAFLIREDEKDEDTEATVYFAEVDASVLKMTNLKSKDLMGKRFEITYEVTEYEEIDENGYTEIYESYKIIKLKKL